MKTIMVKVSDRVMAELRAHITFRCMTVGASGMIDEFVIKFIKAIDNSDKELELQLKSEHNGNDDN